MTIRARFASCAMAGLALTVTSCAAGPVMSPASKAATSYFRDEDNRSAVGLQQKLLSEWEKDRTLTRLRPSVSIASGLFSDHYNIVLGGYVPSTEDRDRAIAGIPETLGLPSKSVVVTDLVKIEK